MNLRITVDDPILEPGESFNVRYRLLPDGDWVEFGEVTSNEFIIPSLPEGDYEIGISWEDCDEVIVTGTVPPQPELPCDCPSVTSVSINESCTGQHMMVVNFSPTSEFNACTFRVFHAGGWTDHTTLSSPLSIPVASIENQEFGLSIYCCEADEWRVCHPTAIVTVINPCSCVSTLTITDAEATDLPGGQTRIDYTFTGSNPNLPPYSGIIYDANNTHNFTVSSPGVNQEIVPFVLQFPATIQLGNRCGINRIDIVSTIPECESAPEVTLAIRGNWDPAISPSTQGYFIYVSFLENSVPPPSGQYVIEILDISAPAGAQVVAALSVSAPGNNIVVPIEKQYYSLDMLYARIVSCVTSTQEYVQWT